MADQVTLRIGERRQLVVWALLLAAVFTAIGEEADHAADLIGIYLFWVAHVGLGLGTTALAMHLLQRCKIITRLSITNVLLAGLCGAVLFAPIALGLDVLGAHFGWVDADQLSGFWPVVLLDEFLGLAPAFMATWLVIQLPFLFASGADEAIAQTDTEPLVGILAALPPALGQDILTIRADLNYVHVATGAGKTMILYSLNRAAEELGEAGIVVRRGVWVAKKAVTRLSRRGRQLYLTLCNGEEVSVSRRKQAEVYAEFGRDFAR